MDNRMVEKGKRRMKGKIPQYEQAKMVKDGKTMGSKQRS